MRRYFLISTGLFALLLLILSGVLALLRQQPPASSYLIAYLAQANADAAPELRLMLPDGSGGRRVAGAAPQPGSELRWVDGLRLSYRCGTLQTCLLHLESGENRPLLHPEAELVDISPDGEWLLFTSQVAEGGNWLQRSPLAGGSTQRLMALPPYGLHRPAWSPDGAWIALLDAQFELLLLRPDGRERRRLLDLYNFQGMPQWSGDGEALLMKRDVQNGSALLRFDLQTREFERLFVVEGENILDFVPAPDGQRFLIRSYSQKLLVVSAGGVKMIEALTLTGDTPQWSPDGAWVIYSSFDPSTGSSAIYRVRPDSSARERLSPLGRASVNLRPLPSPMLELPLRWGWLAAGLLALLGLLLFGIAGGRGRGASPPQEKEGGNSA